MSVTAHPDHPDIIWLATKRGLRRLDYHTGQYRDATLSDGLPSYLFTHAAAQTPDSTLWWGTERGLVYLHHSAQPATLPAPQITEITLAGKTLPAVPRQLKIHTGQPLEFHISAMHFARPDGDILQYRILPDSSWHTTAKTSEPIKIPSLTPGHHTLQLRSPRPHSSITSLSISVSRSHQYHWILSAAALILTLTAIAVTLHRNPWRQKKYTTAAVDTSEYAPTAARLKECMLTQHLYLDPDLRQTTVAEAIGCTPRQLSATLSQHLGTNFADYIGRMRVDEFIRRTADPASVSQLKISALAAECGFASRTSFFRTFRRVTGKTPAQYLECRKNSAPR